MTQRRRRTMCSAGALAILAATLATAAGASRAAAAPPGGPYHFDGPTPIVDTRSTGQLAAGSATAVPAATYVNVMVAGAPESGVVLTFAPCGGGPGRTLYMSNESPSIFFTGDATCVSPDESTHLVLDQIGREASVSDAGFRYVAVPDEPIVMDVEAPNQPLNPGAHPLELGTSVPANAGGVALGIWAVTEKQASNVSVSPCAQPATLPQLRTGTIGFGDFNIAHVPLLPATPMCVHLSGSEPAFVNISVLGYFTDTLADGGDVPPSLETRSEVRPGLVPREPSRVLDTRQGIGAPSGKVNAGGTLALDLSSVVTDDTSAVTLNVTATDPDAAGYVTVYPCAAGLPDSSNLNYGRAANVPNLVIAQPDSDGLVCLFTSATTHLLADLGGTYEWGAGMAYRNEGPRRLLDTRNGAGAPAGPVAADSITRLQVRSSSGEIPTAVTVNLTAVDAGGYGYVTAYPCDQARPEVSNLNYVGGQTVATLSTVKLSATGELCLYSFGRTHLLADLAGSYTASATGRLALRSPARYFDSRQEGITEAHTIWEFGLPLQPSTTTLIANLTATGAQQPGFFTAFDCSPAPPEASNLNYAPGTDVANLAFVPIGADTTICLYNSGTTHELIDVFGWLTPDLAELTLIRGIDF